MNLFDSHQVEKTIPPGCPWSESQESFGTPNVDWCEPTVCSWISEPANTWSNLGYILVALWLYKKFRRDLLLRNFSLTVLAMGLLSGVYHATNNAFTQHMDFFGMILFVSYILAFQILRVFKGTMKSFAALFWFLVSANLTLLICLDFLHIAIQSLLVINAVPIVLLEVVVAVVHGRPKPFGNFAAGLVILIAAQICAQLDLKRIYCHPENVWLHGHVLWHLLCAVAMIFIAGHLRDRRAEIS
jgi:hypothetical protein